MNAPQDQNSDQAQSGTAALKVSGDHLDQALRPKTWEEYVGQKKTKENLRILLTAARERGLACIIAGAGGAAHLPGMLAAKSLVPVLGVPVPSKYLKGVDSLYSMVQMPQGVPVATFAIGEAGAANAALHAIATLAVEDEKLAARLEALRREQCERVLNTQLPDHD